MNNHEGSIHQKDIRIIKYQISNNRILTSTRQNLTELKGEVDSVTIIVESFIQFSSVQLLSHVQLFATP